MARVDLPDLDASIMQGYIVTMAAKSFCPNPSNPRRLTYILVFVEVGMAVGETVISLTSPLHPY